MCCTLRSSEAGEAISGQLARPARRRSAGITRLLRLGVAASCLVSLGCKSEAERACLDQFVSAQAVVMHVEAEELASVEESIAAVAGALASCDAARRSSEVAELTQARNQLSMHRDRLIWRAERREPRELSPEELDRLVKAGDSKCPRGQGYLHAKSGRRIRCEGAQVIDMGSAQAEAYLGGRGYEKREGDRPGELRFEYGGELMIFRYPEGDTARPPRCVVLYPPPDRSWQEATARISGVTPARLQPGRAIPSALGPRDLRVEDSPDKVRVHIGACDP
jgi:hypothetical protein